jgi:hypothetical protein
MEAVARKIAGDYKKRDVLSAKRIFLMVSR